MSKHYLVLTLPEKGDNVYREYVELSEPDESVEDALTRWVMKKLDGRVRNRDKKERELRGSVIYAKLARPSSWYRDNKQGAFAEPNGNGKKSTTKRKGN